MKFIEQFIEGVYVIESEPFYDERGGFERISCAEQLKSIGFTGQFVQSSISYNKFKNTLRGMHYQVEPFAEEKIVKCIKGKIYDVVVDLRENSPTRYKWFAIELSSENKKSLFIPKGCAHGFLTLEDDSEVLYQISNYFSAEHAMGVHFDDSAFEIIWPQLGGKKIVSVKDRSYPFLIRK